MAAAMSHGRRAALAGVLGLLATAGSLGAASSPAAAAGPNFQETWALHVPGVIALSSPVPATIGGVPAVVVGDRNGVVHAVGLAGGHELPGWPVTVPGAHPVDSTPSVLGSQIFVGVGDASQANGQMLGGYLALSDTGRVDWYRQVPLTPAGGQPWGVRSGMAVGQLQGVEAVVAGTMGQQMSAFNAATGATLRGFPWLSSDSEFSTPAIADLYGNGQQEIISGAAQTAGHYGSHVYTEGGHLRILPATGNAGTNSAIGGPLCDFTPNEAVDSSPAVGSFLAGGATGVVVGTSNEMPGVSAENQLFAMTPGCKLAWTATLDGATLSSPALVDALGNGGQQVAEGTLAGSVYLLNGANGGTIWRTHLPAQVIGGVTSADLGGGYQDILAPTTAGLYILDGRSGAIVAHLDFNGVGLQNSALVTNDPNGTLGITVAGYNAAGGEIVHYQLAGSNGAVADQAGAWPMFHNDPQLTGTALTGSALRRLPVPVAPSSLAAGQRLASGQQLTDSAGDALVMQLDGNVVLYRGGRAVWETGTYPHPGTSLLLTRSGDLQAIGANGAVLWSSRTSFGPTAQLVLRPGSPALSLVRAGRVMWSAPMPR